ncbi:MAG: hypothetical protein AAB532_00965 [Patescibacteria group bacterium]
MGGFFIVNMAIPIEKQNRRPVKVFSGDQSLLSSWDSMFKIHGFAVNNPQARISHQFHLADNFGKRNDGGNGLSLTAEVYRYENGREVQPAWFAITEQWPAFPVLSTVPYHIGGFIGEKFDAFANSTTQVLDGLSPDERSSVSEAVHSMRYPLRLPESASDIYALFTSSSSFGIADEGKRSGTSYNFAEIEQLQAESMLRLYGQTIRMVAPERKAEVKDRFRDITTSEGTYHLLVKDKDFPDAALSLYSHLATELGRVSETESDNIDLSDTTKFFELVGTEGEVSENSDAFVFLDWYLQNRDLYAQAHNEVSEELSQKGGNPIQSIAQQKGETPFWVIIDGQKHKMFLDDSQLKIVRRDEGATIEHVIPLETPITQRGELGKVLGNEFKDQAITVIPTAIGLALNFRASGDLLLPEHGSSYMPQADKTYQRMQLLATKEQYEGLIGQNDILRVHPHAIDAMPSGIRIKLPWHLQDAFPTDQEGFTTTDQIKALWKQVSAERRLTLEEVRKATTVTQKAKILFTDGSVDLATNLAEKLDQIGDRESGLKSRSTAIMDTIKDTLDPSQRKQLGQITAYLRGQGEELPKIPGLSSEKIAELEALRHEFSELSTLSNSKPTDERILKFLVALRVRQIDASIESLEYFDSRPSLLTTYLLFGEEGVRRVITGAEVYRQETPKIEKEWFDAEGNKIVVIYDKSGENLPTNPKIAQRIAKSLDADQFDTAMVLTPTEDPNADLRVDQVCPDASVGGMCGNGTRSVGAFAFEKFGKDTIHLVTQTGEIVTGFKENDEYGAVLSATPLDIASRDLFRGIVPDELLDDDGFVSSLQQRLQERLEEDGEKDPLTQVLAFTSISGEPHLVIGLPSIEAGDNENYDQLSSVAKRVNALTIGKKLVFPNEVNVSFVTANGIGEILIATHERGGPGVTGACATGAVSIMSVLKELGQTQLIFKTPKGELDVKYEDGKYTVKGSVVKV